jgi:hypothetical protein
MLGNISRKETVKMAYKTATGTNGEIRDAPPGFHISFDSPPWFAGFVSPLQRGGSWRRGWGKTTLRLEKNGAEQRPRWRPMLGNISPQTEVKMACKTARIRNGFLLDDRKPSLCISLDYPAWYAWLQGLLWGKNSAEQRAGWRLMLGNISQQTEVKIACKTARIRNRFLVGDQTPGPSIHFDSPAWFGWLEVLLLPKNGTEQRARRRPMLGNISQQTEVKMVCKTARICNEFLVGDQTPGQASISTLLPGLAGWRPCSCRRTA